MPAYDRPPSRADDTVENVVIPPAPVVDVPAGSPPVKDTPAEAPAVTDTAAPVRHRRRAGTSPDQRPASAYRAQAVAAGRKPRSGRRRRPTFWRELPLLVVVALLLTFLIQTFLAKVYVIPSGSMETTLHGCTDCENDRVLVDKLSYRFGDPQPGDVVVFRGPPGWSNEFSVPETDNPLLLGFQQLGSLIGLAPPDEKDFVKRVIAVGGQTVWCCDTKNRIVVDDQPIEEPYLYFDPSRGDARQDYFPELTEDASRNNKITVPEGQLWMMGDSRNNSADSRAPGHGPVPVEYVIGKVRLIVLPLPRFGGIDSTNPQEPALVAAAEPLALGLLGVLPLVLRRRQVRGCDAVPDFLPGH